MLLVRTFVAASPIHGIGLYAAEPIRRGTLVWRFEPGLDQIIPPDVVQRSPDCAREYLLRYGYFSPQVPGGLVLPFDNTKFMNHSGDPNTDNTTELTYARRDIAAGEELTCDYREFCTDFDLSL